MSTATANPIAVFGVRHLSPAGAWHLRRFLDRVEPTCVLIEGLADADGLVDDILHRKTIPPIAILAYTQSLPVETLVYPMADYSPEYQALAWAKERKGKKPEVGFCDLPSDVFLGLRVEQLKARAEALAKEAAEAAAAALEEESGEVPARRAPAQPAQDEDEDENEGEGAVVRVEPERVNLYDRFAREAGELDYETYWERNFEHNLADDSYRAASLEFGRGLRELEAAEGGRGERDFAENLVREAYMRRKIHEAIARGHAPEKIAVVCGAFHAPVLDLEAPPMSDEELEKLPRVETKLTLMPYSYFKLSSQSGYGAGNEAPAYYELLWECLQEGDLHAVPAEYLSRIVRILRDSGTPRSTAEVIEGVRLSRAMSALKKGLAPTLADLRDAAVTLIGHGHRSVVADPLARVDVGTAIGSLPPGVSQTSIQDDFNQQLSKLKLAKYKTTVKERIGLDLRENRHVKSEEAAFLDLNRSFFLHRLAVLKIPFAEQQALGPDAATYKEEWELRWTPEAEIALVEAVLLGETVELATGFTFKKRLTDCTSIAEAAKVVRDACECGMPDAMERARRTLQELASESSAFTEVALAAAELNRIVRYGDVRKFDTTPLLPLMQELFVQGSLCLAAAANCDNRAAQQLAPAVSELNRVAIENDELVDEELWVRSLQALADRDDLNPLLSGYACAILLERNLVTTADLAREVSRRLSPGIDADLGAGWFEGLSMRNRYALLSRLSLWEQLAGYVASLDDEEFTRALVFLRRAFGGFSPQEKRTIAENLAEVWGVGGDELSEILEQPLSQEEEESLSELNDFDFGDL